LKPLSVLLVLQLIPLVLLVLQLVLSVLLVLQLIPELCSPL